MVYHVYGTMANACGVLYTGVTRDLERQVRWENISGMLWTASRRGMRFTGWCTLRRLGIYGMLLRGRSS